ncbi:MAG: hypothetical protein ACT4QF_11060 [Sporichthyaceae bacterium]
MPGVRRVALAFAALATAAVLIPLGAEPAMAEDAPGVEPGMPRGFEPGVPPGYEPGVPPGSCAAIEAASQGREAACEESEAEREEFPFGDDDE